MLSIRMQRLGRKGYPTYRVVVQDSRSAPTSGKYVAMLGSYDPHTKQTTLQKDKAEFYLKNGARPSDRVVSLFKAEKVGLPKWVKVSNEKKLEIKNAEKLRRNRPDEPVAKNDEPVKEAEVPTEPNVELAEEAALKQKEETAADQEEQTAKEPEESKTAETDEEKTKP